MDRILAEVGRGSLLMLSAVIGCLLIEMPITSTMQSGQDEEVIFLLIHGMWFN